MTDILEPVRRASIENAVWIPENASDEIKRAKSRWSLYKYLIEQISLSAKKYADAAAIRDADQFQYDILNPGIEIVDDLRFALVRNLSYDDPSRDWNFWTHERFPIDRIKSKKSPHIDRSQLEQTVGRYLELPYRTKAVDRQLLDVLVATELYAFGDEMFNEPILSFLPIRSPLKQPHVAWTYVRGQFINAVVLGGIAAVAGWLSTENIIPQSWADWIAGIAGALFVVFFVFSTTALPINWFRQRKSRRKVVSLLREMVEIYNELSTDGPVSARHILERAKLAAAKGVVWPAPLYALIDDVLSRDGRF